MCRLDLHCKIFQFITYNFQFFINSKHTRLLPVTTKQLSTPPPPFVNMERIKAKMTVRALIFIRRTWRTMTAQPLLSHFSEFSITHNLLHPNMYYFLTRRCEPRLRMQRHVPRPWKTITRSWSRKWKRWDHGTLDKPILFFFENFTID